MRPSRMLATSALAAASILTAALAGAAIPAHASTVSYVALGDSYSSGEGAGNYYSSSGSCDRSPNAYPVLWAGANAPASFTFVACGGATTSDVISTQLSSVTSATTLVSITIGGNDAGFANIMETCVLDSTSTCEAAVASAEQFVQTTLPGRLDTTLNDIRAKAPGARIVVLGYPDFYDTGAWFCLGLSSADHQALNQGADTLDSVLAAAAARHGDPFADVRGAFAGHELCDGSGWLNSVTLPIDSSYHPTATGQKNGYLPVFSAAA